MTPIEQALRYKTNEEHNTMLFWHGPYSQWFYSPFEIDGEMYNCTEQWMMAQKARLFGDVVVSAEIMVTTGPFKGQFDFTKYPREQKKLGRKVRGFNSATWNAVARDVVLRGNLAKFSQNEDLLAALAISQDYILVEASPYDDVWGIKMSDTDEGAFDPAQWKGKNWLGEVVTQTREYLTK